MNLPFYDRISIPFCLWESHKHKHIENNRHSHSTTPSTLFPIFFPFYRSTVFNSSCAENHFSQEFILKGIEESSWIQRLIQLTKFMINIITMITINLINIIFVITHICLSNWMWSWWMKKKVNTSFMRLRKNCIKNLDQFRWLWWWLETRMRDQTNSFYHSRHSFIHSSEIKSKNKKYCWLNPIFLWP